MVDRVLEREECNGSSEEGIGSGRGRESTVVGERRAEVTREGQEKDLPQSRESLNELDPVEATKGSVLSVKA